MISTSTFARRGPAALAGLLSASALVVATALVLPQACGNPRPTGFHTINVAWGDTELGLVWLDRQGSGEHLMFARSAINPLRLKGRLVVAATRARQSEPPIIAWGAGQYLLGWTHVGTDPGVFVRAMREGTPVGEPQRLTEEPTRLCRQMIYGGDAFALAWVTPRGLHLGSVSPNARPEGSAAMTVETHRLATDADVGDCRLVWDGTHYRVAWNRVDGELVVLRVDRRGKVVAEARQPPAGAVSLATAGAESLLVAGRRDGHGATLRRLDRDLAPVSDVEWEVRHVLDAALVPASAPFVIWSDSKKVGAHKGRVSYAFVDEGGQLTPARVLSRFGARPIVNASTSPTGRIAFAWSDNKDEGSVRWGLFLPRASATESALPIDVALAAIGAALDRPQDPDPSTRGE